MTGPRHVARKRKLRKRERARESWRAYRRKRLEAAWLREWLRLAPPIRLPEPERPQWEIRCWYGRSVLKPITFIGMI